MESQPEIPMALVVRTNSGMPVTLRQKQLRIAKQIIEGARIRGLGDGGALIGLITALVESKLKMYANSTVPESLAYPHDDIGSDEDSLNFFQQRVRWWATGTTAERVALLMDPHYAIAEFYRRFEFKSMRGWEARPPGEVAQQIQQSGFPLRYAEWTDAASHLLSVFPDSST